jgi:hypothetical protein
MSWDKINVFQYQQLIPALGIDDPTDQNMRLIAILNGWTDNQVDSLSVEEYAKEKAKLGFLNDSIEGKPVKVIKVNGKRYKCVYDIRKLPSGRYIESKVFSQDLVSNLHKIAASMVIPMKKTIFGWKLDKYDASKHEEYSNDMLEARFVDVYHSIVFFYQVYRNWMEATKDYLITKMMEVGKSHSEAKKEVQNLLNILDGNIAPNLLPTSTISAIMKDMNLELSNT